jgi:uncharacterized protein (TIGR02246 family)
MRMDTDVQTDVRQIADILRRVETAENAGDSDEIGKMLAEDAVIMVPNQPVQEGKTACAAFVRDVLTGLLKEFDRRITYVSAEIHVIGDVAFDRGSFSFTVSPKSGGDATQETGKYLFLYLRATDRSWRIARVIVNLDERDSEPAVALS